MPVTLKTQRDGKTLRPYWYGVYDVDGKRRVINLNLEWKGTPPKGGSLREPGDKTFEKSREDAERILAEFAAEAQRKGRAEHLIERLVEMKTGAAVEYVKIQDLCTRWLSLPRDAVLSEGYKATCRAFFRRFSDFMARRKPKALYCYQVTPADVEAFAMMLREGDAEGNKALSPKTYADHIRTLRPAFDRFLPHGSANPFRAGMTRKSTKNGDGGSIHRKPFTPEELQRLLNTAKDDAFLYPLIVLAVCSGMRRADVCGLKWSAVDFKAGMLTVKTHKTEAEAEIPIFPPLRAVLEAAKGNGKEYVFPEAARMLKENADGLTYRFKKTIAKALQEDTAKCGPSPAPSAQTEAKGAAAIRANIPEGERRDRMLDTLRRYCSGESVRDIARTGSKCTVSADLAAVEEWTGKPFVRTQSPDIKADIARLTRAPRERGIKAASLYDWHALRTTWVTLALSAGVAIEMVRRVTGHGTVNVVLQHYFRPGRAEFKAALAGALPAVITGADTKPSAGEELQALAGKIAAGNATKEDKARLRKLAAKV